MNDHLSEVVTDPAVRTGRSSVVNRVVREYGPVPLGEGERPEEA